MVSGDQAKAIASSWKSFAAKVGGSNEDIGKVFYLKLFEMYPDTQALFAAVKDMSRGELESGDAIKPQGGKVIKRIGEMIDAFGDEAKTKKLMSNHGKYHKRINVGGEYMPKAGAVLEALMSATLGAEYNDCTKAAWAAFMCDLSSSITDA